MDARHNARNFRRVDSEPAPPSSFIPVAVQLAMMTACVNGFVDECVASTSALKLTFVGAVARQFLSAAEAETVPPVLWFAAI